MKRTQKLTEKKVELGVLSKNIGCEYGGPEKCLVFKEMKKAVDNVNSLCRRYEGLPNAEKVSWNFFVRDAENLATAGFLTLEWKLTAKGMLALDAGPGGILLAEILDRFIKDSLDAVEPKLLAGLAAGCLCENEEDGIRTEGIVRDALVQLQKYGIEKLFSTDMQDAVSDWACGESIEESAGIMDAGPGDFVVLTRRAAESLRGLANSTACPDQIHKAARKAFKLVWRDEIAEVF